ncbi:MAG: hypothetical protein JNK05_00025 [Myxococcales bacterium]|nr:hypothetical protein [Myxococcales bacterium]
MALESISERDVYRKFSLDVSALKACLAHPIEDVASRDPGDEDRPPVATHHRCEMHVHALLESARDPAIQRERDRVQQLTSSVRVALDAVRPDEQRAMDFVRELETLARQ